MSAASLRSRLRSSPLLRPLRLARVRRQAQSDGHFDWSDVIGRSGDRWRQARADAKGPRVLIATDVGLHFGASRLDSLLAVALTLRGARVDTLLCDGALPACMIGDISWYADLGRFTREGPQADFCASCYAPAATAWQKLGIEPIRLSSLIEEADRKELAEWADRLDGDVEALRADAIGDQALAGALRFFARSTLEDTPEARAVLRSFLVAARLSYSAAERLVAREHYDVVVLHHGIYVPQGPALVAARDKGARIVSWNVGYRRRSFVFSHGDSYHFTMISERPERWEGLDLTDAWRAELDRYLHSRRHGAEDWIVFGRNARFDAPAYLRERGVALDRPIFLALTNVAWDAQLHYPTNSFASMGEWLVETVKWFATRPELQLVIRVHPGEITGAMPAREKATDILAAAFATLPANVFVVAPDDPISTYSLIELARATIIYATKAGIEVAASGRPLLVAGDAWTRGKGISVDVENAEDYHRRLGEMVEVRQPDAAATERAQRYAFHYFFRRMIPLAATEPASGWPPFSLSVRDLSELEAGADRGLDVVCDGILTGSPFEYPAETLSPRAMAENIGPGAPPTVAAGA